MLKSEYRRRNDNNDHHHQGVVVGAIPMTPSSQVRSSEAEAAEATTTTTTTPAAAAATATATATATVTTTPATASVRGNDVMNQDDDNNNNNNNNMNTTTDIIDNNNNNDDDDDDDDDDDTTTTTTELVQASLVPSEESLRNELKEKLRDQVRDEVLQESSMQQQQEEEEQEEEQQQDEPIEEPRGGVIDASNPNHNPRIHTIDDNNNNNNNNDHDDIVVEGQLLLEEEEEGGEELLDDNYNNNNNNKNDNTKNSRLKRNDNTKNNRLQQIEERKRQQERRLIMMIILFCFVVIIIVVVVIVVTVILTMNHNDDDDDGLDGIIVLPPGQATTSRYWDCKGGSCGCGYEKLDNLIAGRGSNPSFCYSNAMFVAPMNNPFNATFYGTAAISTALGGRFVLGPGCGVCWKLTGTSNVNDDNDDSLMVPTTTKINTTIVVRGADYCPPRNRRCDDERIHFDIAAPGFVPNFFDDKEEQIFSTSTGCDSLEPEFANGLQSCFNWPQEPCDCSIINQTTLRKGCENFLSLRWNNVVVDYENVTCPEELLVTPCQDDGTWPLEPIADECAFSPSSGQNS